MTQPQRGSARTEVGELRNIVDRLDVLMGAGEADGEGAAQSEVGRTILALTERVEALEGEAEELRTLVNHLMTIATWQAKVTATLVGEGTAVDGDAAADEPGQRPPRPGTDWQDADEQQRSSAGDDRDDRVGGNTERIPPVSALDEDIDDILGAGPAPSGRTPAPPDFGI